MMYKNNSFSDNASLDSFLALAGSITQAELTLVRAQERLGDYAVIYRTYRSKQGGGFGDQNKHPYSWGIIVYVDNLPLRINSARGDRREWASLDKTAQWMMENSFTYWWTRNDLEFMAVNQPNTGVLGY